MIMSRSRTSSILIRRASWSPAAHDVKATAGWLYDHRVRCLAQCTEPEDRHASRAAARSRWLPEIDPKGVTQRGSSRERPVAERAIIRAPSRGEGAMSLLCVRDL